MDIVLGLSMTPAAVRMVLVEGQNADGVTIEERQVAVDDAIGSATDHLVTTVRDVRAAAAAGGNRVSSIGVTWTDGLGACVVSEALAACDADNVTPISPFVAATTLAQAVAVAMGYERIAMLFADAESVSMAIVEAADAAIAEIRDEPLDSVDALSAVRILGGWVEALSSRPGGVFVIGSGMDICGFDIVTIKRELETVTSLAVNGPEEPDTALARGAALASANASLHVLSTDAFAYARVADPVETGPDAVTLSRFDVPTVPADAQHIEGFAQPLPRWGHRRTDDDGDRNGRRNRSQRDAAAAQAGVAGGQCWSGNADHRHCGARSFACAGDSSGGGGPAAHPWAGPHHAGPADATCPPGGRGGTPTGSDAPIGPPGAAATLGRLDSIAPRGGTRRRTGSDSRSCCAAGLDAEPRAAAGAGCRLPELPDTAAAAGCVASDRCAERPAAVRSGDAAPDVAAGDLGAGDLGAAADGSGDAAPDVAAGDLGAGDLGAGDDGSGDAAPDVAAGDLGAGDLGAADGSRDATAGVPAADHGCRDAAADIRSRLAAAQARSRGAATSSGLRTSTAS
ncbi:hypothetical protein KQR54_26855 [Mycobacterium gordonae]|uniref:DUF7159 family protein n=1 Tax=Mycobacterium gordonae TaxID=1778 RepID=UPI002108E877|nr:hypothetical protein [Mycobacterium gordonae]MCQ4364698.1 hypothetical protein [Mycobacterium gordonae]